MRSWARPRRKDREVTSVGARAAVILTRDVIPFWTGVVDEEHGGYRLNHDSAGRWRGPAEKFLVSQARTLWSFARLARVGLAPREAADRGYRFLRDRMWDHRWGGFHWAVSHDGSRATADDKSICAQSLALFALCEHAELTADPAERSLCRDLFALLDGHAHDAAHGGYRESFTREWDEPPPDDLGYFGSPPARKLFNVNLHVLEAVTSLVAMDGGDLPRRRLEELMGICGEVVLDPATGGCRNQFHEDWSPLTGPEHDRSSYGHDLENVALLLAAAEAMGLEPGPLAQRCATLTSHALTYGLDRAQGGFFASGPLGRPADRREKLYWTQAEGLLALLRMWQATRDPVYLEPLTLTLDWIESRQVDRAGGDWHEDISPQGVPAGDKAWAWKDPYHQVRALLEARALVWREPPLA